MPLDTTDSPLPKIANGPTYWLTIWGVAGFEISRTNIPESLVVMYAMESFAVVVHPILTDGNAMLLIVDGESGREMLKMWFPTNSRLSLLNAVKSILTKFE